MNKLNYILKYAEYLIRKKQGDLLLRIFTFIQPRSTKFPNAHQT